MQRESSVTQSRTAPRSEADQFDVDLEDGEVLDEVIMTVELISAANQADQRLTTDQIDRILGVA